MHKPWFFLLVLLGFLGCSSGADPDPESVAVTHYALDGGGGGGGGPVLDHLIINEVDYNNPGLDYDEFIEIYNGTGADFALTGYSLAVVDYAGNTYQTIDLSHAFMWDGQFGLVANYSTVPWPWYGSYTLAPNTVNWIRDSGVNATGAGGVALIHAGEVVDSVAWHGSIAAAHLPGVVGTRALTEGGSPLLAADSAVIAGSISRIPSQGDTNNSAADWAWTTHPTPGAPNLP